MNFIKRNIGTWMLLLLVLPVVSGCSASKTTVSQTGNVVQETSEPSLTAGEQETLNKETDAVSSASISLPASVTFDENGIATVEHSYGTTVVPENPQRIVSIKLEDLLLALDVDFVAGRSFDGFYLESEMKEKGIATIAVDESANTVNYEEVLSYKPDLILIRNSFDQTVYDELSKIAPTVAFDLKDSVSSTLAIGAILGMEDQAKERIRQYEDLLAKAGEELQSAVGGETIAMLRIMKNEIRIYPYSKSDMSSFIYQELGMSPDPLTVESDTADNLAISMEKLPELKADHIILIAGYGSISQEDIEAAKARYEEIKADPLWQNVPAVKSGNIYEVDSRKWLNHGLICTEMKAQELVDLLTGK